MARGEIQNVRDYIAARVRNEDRGYLSSCWIWRLRLNPYGYATGRAKFAHRLAYEEWVGPIPAGFEIDHLCRVKSCVNPDHLEAVTGFVNRSRAKTSQSGTRCLKGHEYTPENTEWDRKRGTRRCRQCRCTTRREIRRRAAARKSCGDRAASSSGPDTNNRNVASLTGHGEGF